MSSCAPPPRQHIAGPYFFMTPERLEDTAIFLCFRLSDGELGCEKGALPDGLVVKAGGDEQFIVFAKRKDSDRASDENNLEYYYFRRPDFKNDGGYYQNFVIKGPMNKGDFEIKRKNLDFPEFTVELR